MCKMCEKAVSKWPLVRQISVADGVRTIECDVTQSYMSQSYIGVADGVRTNECDIIQSHMSA